MSEWFWDAAKSGAVYLLPTGVKVVLGVVYVGSHARQTYDTAVWMKDWVHWARGSTVSEPSESWMWIEKPDICSNDFEQIVNDLKTEDEMQEDIDTFELLNDDD